MPRPDGRGRPPRRAALDAGRAGRPAGHLRLVPGPTVAGEAGSRGRWGGDFGPAWFAERNARGLVPEPILLLGLRPAWPIPFHGGRCPVGHGERLPAIDACLVCDRSGIDDLLPSVERVKRYARRAGKGLKGGVR